MFRYNLFIINNNSYKIYKNNSKYLYEIFCILNNIRNPEFIYGINLYKSICDIFSVRLLKNYIKEKYIVKNIDGYLFLHNEEEKTYIKINHSRIILISNIKNPKILNIFNIYNKKIFVIDFKNGNYEWLNDKISQLKTFKTYNNIGD